MNFIFFTKGVNNSEQSLNLEEISIRDPNIFFWEGTYYLTGTTAIDGFLGYSSIDLVNWVPHGYIYQKNVSNYWAQYDFWAPEIVEKDGKFYLFFTGKSATTRRATGVAVADSPIGPYSDLISNPLTPSDYECLDGHLAKDIQGNEYLIYVYEWLQAGEGEMWIQSISPDYSHLEDDPVVLFKGGDAPWSNYVVDGPSLFIRDGFYYLFWSSFNENNYGRYGVGYAKASNITGPYVQSPYPLAIDDGGHSTWFYNNNSQQLLLTFHQPNSKTEHAVIREMFWDEDNGIWLISPQDSMPFAKNIRILLYLGVAAGLVCIGMFFWWRIKSKKK